MEPIIVEINDVKSYLNIVHKDVLKNSWSSFNRIMMYILLILGIVLILNGVVRSFIEIKDLIPGNTFTLNFLSKISAGLLFVFLSIPRLLDYYRIKRLTNDYFLRINSEYFKFQKGIVVELDDDGITIEGNRYKTNYEYSYFINYQILEGNTFKLIAKNQLNKEGVYIYLNEDQALFKKIKTILNNKLLGI